MIIVSYQEIAWRLLWKIWFYSNAYIFTKSGAYDSWFKIFS